MRIHTLHVFHCLALVSLSLTFSFSLCVEWYEGSEVAQSTHLHIILQR